MTRRTLKKSARIEKALELEHNGAAVAFKLTIATEQHHQAAMQEAVDAAGADGAHVCFARLEHAGRTARMPAYEFFGMVNTIEPAEVVKARLSALCKRKLMAEQGQHWIGGSVRCLTPLAEDAAAQWAELLGKVEHEVHRPQGDGETVLVMAKGNEGV